MFRYAFINPILSWKLANTYIIFLSGSLTWQETHVTHYSYFLNTNINLDRKRMNKKDFQWKVSLINDLKIQILYDIYWAAQY